MIAVLALSGGKAEAATKVKAPSVPQKITAYLLAPTGKNSYYPEYGTDGYKMCSLDKYINSHFTIIKINNLASDAKITNIKSSNPKVMTAKSYKKGVRVKIKNFGTSKISFNVKQNGKTYKLSYQYTIKRTPSPFKNVKIEGKQYTSKFNGK